MKDKLDTLIKASLILAIGFFVFSLMNYNRRQVEQNEYTLKIAERLDETTVETQQLICDIILSLRQPTEGQQKACAGFKR